MFPVSEIQGLSIVKNTIFSTFPEKCWHTNNKLWSLSHRGRRYWKEQSFTEEFSAKNIDPLSIKSVRMIQNSRWILFNKITKSVQWIFWETRKTTGKNSFIAVPSPFFRDKENCNLMLSYFNFNFWRYYASLRKLLLAQKVKLFDFFRKWSILYKIFLSHRSYETIWKNRALKGKIKISRQQPFVGNIQEFR